MVGALIVGLGTWPGKVAKRRGHPQLDAINVMSWLGIITMGLLWPIALVWAYTRPPYMLQATGEPLAGSATDEITSLRARIEYLEEQIRQLGPDQGGQR
jgi:hypothetical protein